jgi:transposase-like protein
MATVEVITSVERRRRWSREAKLRIVAESARPDCTVSQVARAHDIVPGQLFTWRRELLAAAIVSHGGEGDRGDTACAAPRLRSDRDVATPAARASGRADSRGCGQACHKAAWPRIVAAPIWLSRRAGPSVTSSRRLMCV